MARSVYIYIDLTYRRLPNRVFSPGQYGLMAVSTASMWEWVWQEFAMEMLHIAIDHTEKL